MAIENIVSPVLKNFGLSTSLSKSERFQNIKSNFVLIISALSFYVVSTPGKSYISGLFMAFIALVISGSQFKSLLKSTSAQNRFIRIFSAISAIGIAENAVEIFFENWSKRLKLLHRLLGENYSIFLIIFSVACAVFSLPFLYTAICLFFAQLKKRFPFIKNDISSMPKAELIFYALFIIAGFVYMTTIFNQTYSFYDPELELEDLIYTSDTRYIARPNAYLSITNGQNDLRQPLFAVFSAPFIAFPYAVSLPFRLLFPYSSFYFMNYAQIAILVFSIVLLSHLVSKNPIARISFSLLLSFSFPYLLFSLIMEQYVIATFYLILFIYSVYKNKNDKFLLFGAIGTLTTSAILTPLILDSKKDKKKWIQELFILGFAFIFVMILFFRGDTLVRIFSEIKTYMLFTGKGISFTQRCMQYFSFVSSCFAAPISSRYFKTGVENFSWQLSPITTWNIAGIAILFLCAISAVVNRKNLLCRISAIWILFSVLLLCFFGWGCAENGQVLYTLYFSWAFAVLLFMLFSAIAKIIPHFEKAACSVLCIVFLKCNIPMLKELFVFASEICPR